MPCERLAWRLAAALPGLGVAECWLDGEGLYTDLIDVNLPLIVLPNALPAALDPLVANGGRGFDLLEYFARRRGPYGPGGDGRRRWQRAPDRAAREARRG